MEVPELGTSVEDELGPTVTVGSRLTLQLKRNTFKFTMSSRDLTMPEMVYCRGCGKQLHKTAQTCPSCGAMQVTELRSSGDLRTQTAAGLWCIFLGAFGAHWFYLRNIVLGVFSLLFCWTGIPGVVAFVNGFQIAFGNRQKWDRKYNNGIETPPVHWVVQVAVIALPLFSLVFWSAVLSSR